jgi:kynurenine formamidase
VSTTENASPRGTYTEEDFRKIGDQVRNWGRWGDADQIGTLNFITPEIIAGAAKLVKRGATFALGIPFDAAGPQLGKHGRNNPLHVMTETGDGQNFPGPFRYADDYIVMPLQGASQWDGLSHVFYDGKMYNGYSSDENVTPHGAATLGIEHIADGVAGRGVLLDVAKHRGVDWLQMGEVITPEELDAVAAAQGVEVRSGDILCVRTGWRKKFLADGHGQEFMAGEPGIGMGAIEWLHRKDVAAIACDNWAVEVLEPSEGFFCGEIHDMVLNVHCILIRDMGLTLGEILDFELLAADCASDGIYEFFFCGPPLQVTGAVGSPINPLAFK